MDRVGKVAKLSSNSDGKGVLAVEIGKGLTLKTWNNSLSDLSDRTLIEPRTSLFERAIKLQEGQPAVFSGLFFRSETDCIREQSLTISGSMTEPEFLMRFSAISPWVAPGASNPNTSAPTGTVLNSPALQSAQGQSSAETHRKPAAERALSAGDFRRRDQSLLATHPVQEATYQGQARMPDFKGRDRPFVAFRTRLRNAMRAGPNFAGRLALVQFGCGTSCSMVYVGDLTTGHVTALPLNGEDKPSLHLTFDVRSRILIAYYGAYEEACTREVFLWDGTFARLDTTTVSERAACDALLGYSSDSTQ